MTPSTRLPDTVVVRVFDAPEDAAAFSAWLEDDGLARFERWRELSAHPAVVPLPVPALKIHTPDR